MIVGDCLLANGEVAAEDLAGGLVAWLPTGRGKGRATSVAVRWLTDGLPWWEAGEHSDGNGAAMRVAPIGLAYATRPEKLRRAAALSAVVTHRGAMAVAGAVAQALAVALALHSPAGSLDAGTFIDTVAASIDDLPDPGAPERRAGTLGHLVCFEAADLSAYLLDDSYSEMLNDDEKGLRDALVQLRKRRDQGADGPAWDRVARRLDEFSVALVDCMLIRVSLGPTKGRKGRLEPVFES